MLLDLPDQDIDFIMRVLHTTPLLLTEVGPVVNRISAQVVAEQQKRSATLSLVPAVDQAAG